MSSVTPADLSKLFSDIAMLLDLKGENPFKIRAYSGAARAFETYRGDLGADIANGALGEVPGIGKAILEKSTEFYKTGKLEFFENLRRDFPPGLFELFDLNGLGAKKIKVLYEQVGVASLLDLEQACIAGKIAGIPGFGAKTQENILKSIAQKRQHAGTFLLGEIVPLAEDLFDALRDHPAVSQISYAGSYRRRKETVHDLDFVVSTREPEEVGNYFADQPEVTEVIAHGPTKVSVRLLNGIQADLRLVSDEAFACAVMYFTGSKEHNVVLRGRARDRGWTLNEYRLAPLEEAERPKDYVPPPTGLQTEADVYRALGLDFVPPELRENLGEIEAAEKHRLPNLVELTNLRGTFHNHSVYSDGQSTVAEMAAAAHELGLSYLGMADHSKGQVQANGMSAERLRAQFREIDELNANAPWAGDFRLLKGVEVDILRDGSLDLPDDVLAECDYTVASVHGSFSLSEEEQTERILKAIRHPLVTMLGHATGRLLLQRDGYQVNIRALLEAAGANGTIIEINANPHRLDLDWRWWPEAKRLGVLTSINPDAHSIEGLQSLWFGIAMARKGWLTKHDVLNTRRIEEVLPILGRKRG
jgi:DNA polymerase (family 10)